MKARSYFQQIAPGPAVGRTAAMPVLRPAPPLFRQTSAAFEEVEVHEAHAQPVRSAPAPARSLVRDTAEPLTPAASPRAERATAPAERSQQLAEAPSRQAAPRRADEPRLSPASARTSSAGAAATPRTAGEAPRAAVAPPNAGRPAAAATRASTSATSPQAPPALAAAETRAAMTPTPPRETASAPGVREPPIAPQPVIVHALEPRREAPLADRLEPPSRASAEARPEPPSAPTMQVIAPMAPTRWPAPAPVAASRAPPTLHIGHLEVRVEPAAPAPSAPPAQPRFARQSSGQRSAGGGARLSRGLGVFGLAQS